MEELGYLAAYLYDKDTVGGDTASVSGTLNTTKLTNLSNILSTTYTSNGNYLYLCTGSESSALYAYHRNFNSGSSVYGYGSDARNLSNFLGVCVQ